MKLFVVRRMDTNYAMTFDDFWDAMFYAGVFIRRGVDVRMVRVEVNHLLDGD